MQLAVLVCPQLSAAEHDVFEALFWVQVQAAQRQRVGLRFFVCEMSFLRAPYRPEKIQHGRFDGLSKTGGLHERTR